jgi:hypothetical protein
VAHESRHLERRRERERESARVLTSSTTNAPTGPSVDKGAEATEKAAGTTATPKDRTAALTPALKGRLKRKRPAKSPGGGGTPARLGPMDPGGGGRDAPLVSSAPKPIRFEDLGGLEPAMQAIEEAVLFPLRHPEVYAWLGVEPPRGILLHGPPGCGKTSLAHAIATEAGCTFFNLAATEVSLLEFGLSGIRNITAREEGVV